MNLNLPPLPEPAFRLKWRDGAYYVSKPNIGDTDVFTAEQVEAIRREAVREAVEACARVVADCEAYTYRHGGTTYDDATLTLERAAAAIRALLNPVHTASGEHGGSYNADKLVERK